MDLTLEKIKTPHVKRLFSRTLRCVDLQLLNKWLTKDKEFGQGKQVVSKPWTEELCNLRQLFELFSSMNCGHTKSGNRVSIVRRVVKEKIRRSSKHCKKGGKNIWILDVWNTQEQCLKVLQYLKEALRLVSYCFPNLLVSFLAGMGLNNLIHFGWIASDDLWSKIFWWCFFMGLSISSPSFVNDTLFDIFFLLELKILIVIFA